MDQSIVSKPTILLYATQHISADILKSVLYGIEEEGLPVVIEFHSGTHMTSVSYTHLRPTHYGC